MCMAITMQGKHFYFGRNLDLARSFGERVTVTPRGFELRFAAQPSSSAHYAMIGTAAAEGLFPLYAEAMNERGLCAAGLNFPESAVYGGRREGMYNVAPHEMIAWLLCRCANAAQAKLLLQNTCVVGEPFGALPVAPLHWLVADRTACFAVEPRADGLHIEDDPFGVLANEPPFPFHAENIRHYLNCTAAYPASRCGIPLAPYGFGAGGFGLPGDLTSASRFVRAAFYRANAGGAGESPEQEALHFFHILGSVEAVRGGALGCGGEREETRYACCMDAVAGIYYRKEYGSGRIRAYALAWTEGERLTVFAQPSESGIERVPCP